MAVPIGAAPETRLVKINIRLWEGRAMIAGRLSKSNVSILLAGNVIKRQLKLPLTHEEQDAEKRLNADQPR